MKILIFTDLEGASGIGNSNIIESTEPDIINQGRKFLTDDVNSAIRGLRRAEATQIDIFDGHAMDENLIIEDLENDVNYLGGVLP